MAVFDDIKQLTGIRNVAKGKYAGDILDMYFLRLARRRGLRLATGTDPDRYVYFGAHVYTPRAGLNENVIYVDLASLYPNLMRALNVGPDTVIGDADALEASQWTEDDCLTGYVDYRPVKHVDDGHWSDFTDGTYKIIYDPDKPKIQWTDDPQYEPCYFLHPDVREGFIADGVQDLIDLKDAYRGESIYEALKGHVVNGVYGFTGEASKNKSSRLYDWRIAESVTLAGRKVIQESARAIREYMDEHCGIPMDETYVAIGDTDGAGICWPKASSRAVMLDAVEEAVEYLNGEHYPEFMSSTFGVPRDRHYMDIELESYAPRLFVPAKNPSDPDDDRGRKKRYAQWVSLDEGANGLEEVDELDITGLEYVRSDVSPITRDVQYDVLNAICREKNQTAFRYTAERLREAEDGVLGGEVDIEYVAKRGGIGQPLEEYGTASRRPGPKIRGAKYMANVYGQPIGEGDKPFVVYLSSPDGLPEKTYTAETAEDGDVVDALSAEDARDLPDGISINWTKHNQKAVVDPMRPIIRTMGWSWEGIRDHTQQSGLAEFC